MTGSGPAAHLDPLAPSIARGILDQARPIVVGQVAVMLYGAVDTVFTGHASATDLAAMGLGSGVYSSVFVTLLGMLNALNPIIGQHHGGGRHTAIGVSYVQGLWLALLLSTAGGLFLAFPGPWLGRIHAPPDVEAVVTRYLLVLAVAMPAALMFRVISALNIGVARPRVVMRMQVAGLALKVVLSYGLIFGALGLPRLGAVGGALASGIVFWALFVAGWAHTRLDPFYHRFAIQRAVPRWSVLHEQIQLGIPMGLSYAVEATSFTFITLLVARLGTSVMAGHQIVANLAALCFMVPLSLAVATATLTAHAIGAEDAGRAQRTAATGIRIALIAGASLALAVWTLRHPVVRLYTNDAVGFVLRAFRGVWGPPWGVTGMWMMERTPLPLSGMSLRVPPVTLKVHPQGRHRVDRGATRCRYKQFLL